MKIITSSSAYGDRTMSVAEYIESGLTADSGRGVVEDAQQTAQRCAKAIGMLVERLVDEGKLSLDEISKLAGPYAYGAKIAFDK